LCLICNREKETEHHFLSCRGYESEKIPPVTKKIAQLMKRFGVDPYLRVILIRGLRAGKEGGGRISLRDIPAEYE